MGHHTCQAGAQSNSKLEQKVVVGGYAAALLTTVDLDQGAWWGGVARDGNCGGRVVRDHNNLRARRIQRGHPIKLLRRDADGVEDVGDTVTAKVLRLRQRGDGDTAW